MTEKINPDRPLIAPVPPVKESPVVRPDKEGPPETIPEQQTPDKPGPAVIGPGAPAPDTGEPGTYKPTPDRRTIRKTPYRPPRQ